MSQLAALLDSSMQCQAQPGSSQQQQHQEQSKQAISKPPAKQPSPSRLEEPRPGHSGRDRPYPYPGAICDLPCLIGCALLQLHLQAKPDPMSVSSAQGRLQSKLLSILACRGPA